MMKLSVHFQDRWKERVGKPLPSPEKMEELIDGALYLQRCRDLFTARGIRQRILAAYWITDQNVIVKIDEKAGVAVTVLTADMTFDEEVS